MALALTLIAAAEDIAEDLTTRLKIISCCPYYATHRTGSWDPALRIRHLVAVYERECIATRVRAAALEDTCTPHSLEAVRVGRGQTRDVTRRKRIRLASAVRPIASRDAYMIVQTAFSRINMPTGLSLAVQQAKSACTNDRVSG